MLTMDLGLTGRTFLLTGASQGLGLAAAEALVAEGATVVLSARDECRLAAVVNVIGRLDGDPTVLGAIRDGDRIRVEAA